MRHFLYLTYSLTKMTVRNRQSLFWMFVFPALVMSLLGIVFGSGLAKPSLGIVQEDDTPLAVQIVKGLKEMDSVRTLEGSRNTLLRRLEQGEIQALVVLGKGFARDYPEGESTVDLYLDPTGDFTTELLRAAVFAAVTQIDQNTFSRKAGRGLSLESHEVASRRLRYIDFLLPGVVAMTVMNGALFGLGGAVVRYRERGVLRRVKVTPLPLRNFLAAQIANQVIFALLRTLVLILVAVVFFSARVTGGLLETAVVVLAGSICFVTIGLTTASLARTREVADTLSNIVSMPMVFLAGVFFSVEGAPNWIKPLIEVLPLKFLADALRDVMVKGFSLADTGAELGYLMMITAFFFMVSVRLFKWE